MICDTSALVSFFNGADPNHAAVVRTMRAARPPLVVGTLVLAELDHLVRTRVGDEAARQAVGALLTGRFEIAACDHGDIEAALAVDARYSALGIGLTDASLVVLASRYRTTTVATLDERHFRAIRPILGGPAFRILPADAGPG